MAVINSRTRYRASSEQQKLLQRNISSQAEFARLTTERADLRRRQQALDRLTALSVVADHNTLDSFIDDAWQMVSRVLTPVLPVTMY
jgi:hypothetical protein